MSNQHIKCPECSKPIGEYVYQRTSKVPGLGAMNAYECKYDYRKTSHISFGRGLMCKTCARKFFPDGIAYKVTNNYHGKRITPYVGINQTGFFSNKDEAKAMANECNRKCYDNDSRVEEVRL